MKVTFYFKYSVNRAWVAAVNSNIDIDYKGKKPPARHPIGGPRQGECHEIDYLLQVQCEPRMDGWQL
jgi:hypothetical protein